jgi:response regulator RpfG family c-di-GMP phosphodiesterase
MMRSLLTTFGLGQRRKPAGEVGRAASDAGRKTVFIIEDSRDCLSAMLLALAGETYRIETADHADLAIWKLSSGQPDLILLNSRMLASDGTRLASRLIADENLVSIPMVALGAGWRNSPEVSGQF